MRLFLAIFPPAEAQGAAHAVIESLRRPGDGVSWVKRENLHYTLRFMGELGEDGARRAGEAAVEAASRSSAFEAALGEAGAFPKAARARVLWLGLTTGAEPMVSLAGDLDQALKRRGFDRADKPFSAHLTIGRVRERDQDWSAALAGARAEGAPFRVDKISLIESRLSPKGSIYTERLAAPLAGSRA